MCASEGADINRMIHNHQVLWKPLPRLLYGNGYKESQVRAGCSGQKQKVHHVPPSLFSINAHVCDMVEATDLFLLKRKKA